MFCPKCKCEYAKGKKVCPDCNVALVKKLTEEPLYELVKVFTSGNPGTIAIAKGVLESEGIRYFINNEFMQSVYGIGSGFPAEIIVREIDKERAISLLSVLK